MKPHIRSNNKSVAAIDVLFLMMKKNAMMDHIQFDVASPLSTVFLASCFGEPSVRGAEKSPFGREIGTFCFGAPLCFT